VLKKALLLSLALSSCASVNERTDESGIWVEIVYGTNKCAEGAGSDISLVNNHPSKAIKVSLEKTIESYTNPVGQYGGSSLGVYVGYTDVISQPGQSIFIDCEGPHTMFSRYSSNVSDPSISELTINYGIVSSQYSE